jgi:ribosome-associated protein
LNQPDVFEIARTAARAADEKLGQDIIAVDVRRESSLVDCFLLITGMTHLHIGAIEDAVREALRAGGANLVRTDGQRGHLWRALDYGNFIVHIMDKKTRDFYAIEKLWERAKPIVWKPVAAPKPVTTPKPVTSSKPAVKNKTVKAKVKAKPAAKTKAKIKTKAKTKTAKKPARALKKKAAKKSAKK